MNSTQLYRGYEENGFSPEFELSTKWVERLHTNIPRLPDDSVTSRVCDEGDGSAKIQCWTGADIEEQTGDFANTQRPKPGCV